MNFHRTKSVEEFQNAEEFGKDLTNRMKAWEKNYNKRYYKMSVEEKKRRGYKLYGGKHPSCRLKLNARTHYFRKDINIYLGLKVKSY